MKVKRQRLTDINENTPQQIQLGYLKNPMMKLQET